MLILFSSTLLLISSTLIFLVSIVTMKSFDDTNLSPITCVSGRNSRRSGTSSAQTTVTLLPSFFSTRYVEMALPIASPSIGVEGSTSIFSLLLTKSMMFFCMSENFISFGLHVFTCVF